MVCKINTAQQAVREKVEILAQSHPAVPHFARPILRCPDNFSRFVQRLVHFTIPDLSALGSDGNLKVSRPARIEDTFGLLDPQCKKVTSQKRGRYREGPSWSILATGSGSFGLEEFAVSAYRALSDCLLKFTVHSSCLICCSTTIYTSLYLYMG